MKHPKLSSEWIGKGPLVKVCLSIVETCLVTHTKPEGAVLAYFAKRLIAAESKPGGPYYNDKGLVDLPTNIAVGYVCAFLGIPLPHVATYIEAHRSEAKSREVKQLLEKYDDILNQLANKPVPDSQATIFAAAASKFSQFDEPLSTLSLRFLTRMQKADTNHEIALFPAFFYDSLLAPKPDLPLDQLGEANVYCWAAYTIYDHLLDGQSPIEYLPVANIAMRLAFLRYQALFPPEHPFMHKVKQTFDEMDTANSWEQAQSHFELQNDSIIISSLPAYGQLSLLARRSFGHALGPLAIAWLSGFSPVIIRHIEKGMRHYLIARQLSDDLYDWQDDLKKGSCSAVVATLLRRARIQPDIYNTDELTLRLATFWQQSAKVMTKTLHRHVVASHESFLKTGIVGSEGPLLELITNLDKRSYQTNKRALDFLAAYRA